MIRLNNAYISHTLCCEHLYCLIDKTNCWHCDYNFFITLHSSTHNIGNNNRLSKTCRRLQYNPFLSIHQLVAQVLYC